MEGNQGESSRDVSMCVPVCGCGRASGGGWHARCKLRHGVRLPVPAAIPRPPRLSSQSSQALCMASQGPQASHTLRRRQIGQGRSPLAPWLRVPTGTGSGGPRITESPGSGARCDLMREWPECEYSVPPRVGTVRVFLSLYFFCFRPEVLAFFRRPPEAGAETGFVHITQPVTCPSLARRS